MCARLSEPGFWVGVCGFLGWSGMEWDGIEGEIVTARSGGGGRLCGWGGMMGGWVCVYACVYVCVRRDNSREQERWKMLVVMSLLLSLLFRCCSRCCSIDVSRKGHVQWVM